MIIFIKKKNLPLIIVAATSKQEDYTTFAKCLFHSHVCDPVLEYYSGLKDGVNYNLAYLSSEHGLIPSSAVVSPYSEFMTPAKVEKSADGEMRQKAEALFDIYEPSEVVLACPEIHTQLFHTLLPDAVNKTLVHEPKESFGIIYLRTMLAHHLECYKSKSMRVFFSFKENDTFETNVCLELFIGDRIDCVVDSHGDNKIINENVVVSSINEEKNTFYCQDGTKHDQLCVKNGLNKQFILALKRFSKPFKLGDNINNITVTLSELRNDVKRFEKQEKIA